MSANKMTVSGEFENKLSEEALVNVTGGIDFEDLIYVPEPEPAVAQRGTGATVKKRTILDYLFG